MDTVTAFLLCYYEVIDDGMRLHSQPSTSSAVVGRLRQGDQVSAHWADHIDGFQYVHSPRHGRSGWMHSSELRLTGHAPW